MHPDRDKLEESVAACVKALETGQPEQVEAILEAAGPLAGEIRQQLALLRALGFLGTDGPRDPSAVQDFGRYQVESTIAAGGMGIVYRARDRQLDRTVALKVIQPHLASEPRVRERFRREIETVAALDHPGIVRVFDAGEEQGLAYFVMEYVEGLTLAQVLQQLSIRGVRSGALPVRELLDRIPADAQRALRAAWQRMQEPVTYAEFVCRIGCEIADGLQYAHARKILHRDVKPSNVLIGFDGRVLLFDFGLALDQERSRLTAEEEFLGTLQYAAPEVLAGETGDIRSDVYSLGLTLRELVTPSGPGEASSGAVGAPLRRVLDRATAAARPDRYSHAGLLARDLEHVVRNEPLERDTDGRYHRARRFARRHSRILAAAGLVLVTGLVSLGLVRSSAAWERGESARLQGLLRRVTDQRLRNEKVVETNGDLLQQTGRLDVALTITQLLEREPTLYPMEPDVLPAMEQWLAEAESVEVQRHQEFLDRWTDDSVGDRVRALRSATRQVLDLHGRLVDAKGDMLERIERTHRDIEVCFEQHAEDWEIAIDEIALCDTYDGLEIEPQPGFVPLAPHPVTGFYEFWIPASGERPEEDPDLGAVWGPEAGIVMVLLPGGVVPGTDPPFHVGPFFLAKYECTMQQFARMFTQGEVNVSGHDAITPHTAVPYSMNEARFWFQRRDMDVATEAQWVYAAHGGTETRFPGARTAAEFNGKANLRDGPYDGGVWHDGFESASLPGSFPPNPFGLFDMIGNAKEMCRTSNPELVYLRGGSWDDPPEHSDFKIRFTIDGTKSNLTWSFRVVKEIDP